MARRRYAAAGDAARGFCNGNSGTADEAPCPEADIGHALPIISDASRNAIAIVRRTQLRTLLVSGWSCTRIGVLRFGLIFSEELGDCRRAGISGLHVSR